MKNHKITTYEVTLLIQIVKNLDREDFLNANNLKDKLIMMLH